MLDFLVSCSLNGFRYTKWSNDEADLRVLDSAGKQGSAQAARERIVSAFFYKILY